MKVNHKNTGNKNAFKADKLKARFYGRVSLLEKSKWENQAKKEGLSISKFIVKAVNSYIK